MFFFSTHNTETQTARRAPTEDNVFTAIKMPGMDRQFKVNFIVIQQTYINQQIIHQGHLKG